MTLGLCERLRKAAQHAGVTRVADVTWLDCIGYPVAQATRPHSRNYVVSQGKGGDQTSAWISAVMESLEFFLGEQISSDVTSPLEEISERLGYDSTALPLLRAVASNEQLRWTTCEDIVRERATYMPFDMVCLDFTREHSAPFRNTSNGFGAGVTWETALQHALLELIERHNLSAGNSQRLFIDPTVRALLGEPMRAAGDAGIKMAIYSYESELPIPTLKVLLHEPGSGIAFSGTAAHFDPQVCLRKAAGEAFQSRLIHISGARDDLTELGYERLFDGASIRATTGNHGAGMRMSTFSEYERSCKAILPISSSSLIHQLKRTGYNTVLVKQLQCAGVDIPVLVAAVPGLRFTWQHAT